MIQLRLQNLRSGNFFVLAKDGTLTIDLNSTIFNNQDEFLGSLSYPGTMPLEPNKAEIKNADLIASDVALRTLPAMLWLGALPYKQVKLIFTVEDDIINYTLYFDSATIANLLKSLDLTQLALNSDTTFMEFADEAALLAFMTATAGDAPGTHPMIFAPYMNDKAYLEQVYINTPAYLGTEIYNPGEKFLYTDNHIYQVNTVTTAGQTPVSNPEKFSDITLSADILTPVSPVINRWEMNDLAVSGFVVDGSGPKSQTQTPFFLVTFLLKRIIKYFGYTPAGRWLQDESSNRIVLFSDIALNYALSMGDVSLFMPAVKVTDFLKEVRTAFGLLIDFDATRNICIVESLGNLETFSEKIDLRPYQQAKGFRETGTSSNAYTVTQNADDQDKAFSDTEKANLPVLTIGDPLSAIQTTDITLQSVATKMLVMQRPYPIAETSPILSNWRVPLIQMPIVASSPMDQATTKTEYDRGNFKLRFLYYYGMVADDSGYLYPYISSDNLDALNNPIGNVTLALNPAGTAFLATQAYYSFLQNCKPFEMVFSLTRAIMMRIKANALYLVNDKNRACISCILDQCSADIETGQESITGKLTLYPIIREDNKLQVIDGTPAPPPPPFDNGLVYAKLVLMNPQSKTHEEPLPEYQYDDADFNIEFYEDAGGTIAKVVVDLPVIINQAASYEVDGHVVNTAIHRTAEGDIYNALTSWLTFTQDPGGLSGHSITYIYALSPSAHYTII